ncbi:MAG: DUF1566 domain-containing protein [bacterium]|nr:DUF1566 domain-containing protein [bacterium]
MRQSVSMETRFGLGVGLVGVVAVFLTGHAWGAADSYPVVDTGQDQCYNAAGSAIAAPSVGQAFHGQDAQYTGIVSSYTFSGGALAVYDTNTRLTWQRTADTDGDGDIDASDKLTWAEAQAYPATLNAASYGGYTDWRLPSIKELYSLMDFRGTDPSGYEGSDTSGLVPYIDTDYFDFAYGDTSAGERIIDAQYASSTLYVSTTGGGDQTLFGVNFADGRIKGYGLSLFGSDKTFFVICCRGNSDYGANDYANNGDGTVTDSATGLMWQQADSGSGLTWEAALSYAENLTLGGHNDWRLPNAKELQSIVDYARSPDTTASPAIDPVFGSTAIVNEAGAVDYAAYWTGTTHVNWTASPGAYAAYVCFGRAMGYMNGGWLDVHGAGAQRSDPKTGDPGNYPTGHGPQGDAIRIYNYVRCVRDAEPPVIDDLDGDGLTNDQETQDLDLDTPGVQNPFDPDNADTTGDNGQVGADGVPDGQNDWDGDGMTNAQEFTWGYDPLDPTSFTEVPAAGAFGLCVLVLLGAGLLGVRALQRAEG